MKTQRLRVKWVPFWMAALSVGALCCAGDPSRRDAGQPMAGAGGANDALEGRGGNPGEVAGGNPSEVAGGGPSEVAGGGPSEVAGGGPSEVAGGGPSEVAGGGPSEVAGGSGGSPSDTDPGDTAVEWEAVAMGSFPGSDGSGTPCSDVQTELLHDQAELDQWAIDQGITTKLEFIVDWTTESALGAVTLCSTSGHMIEGGDLAHDGSGGLTAEFTITDLAASFSVPTVAWTVFSVAGRAWTDVSATTID